MSFLSSHARVRSPPRSNLSLTINPSIATTGITATVTSLPRQDSPQKLSHCRGRLMELLLSCASHTASANLPGTEACLRLISSLSSASDDSLARLAARLATALAARLLRNRLPGLLFALHHPTAFLPESSHLCFARSLPFIPICRAIAASTLLHSLAHDGDVHLIELGPTTSSADLWVPILHAFARQPNGAPVIKLTCVGTNENMIEPLGSALLEEAKALELNFEFNIIKSQLCKLNHMELLVSPCEAVAAVCTLSLHRLLAKPESCSHFLLELRRVATRMVVVVVEQELEDNERGMVERFAEVVNYYQAVFEAVEDALREKREREGVEEMLGREIENVLACEDEERVERHERMENWGERMKKAGFQPGRVWYDTVEEAKRVMMGWEGKGSYGLAIESGCLMICWKDRPLFAVSVWH